MPVYAVYIEKQVPFQGRNPVFGNTYHYKVPESASNDQLRNAANEVMSREQAVTVNEVNFVRLVTWGPTDQTEFDNIMRTDDIVENTTGDLLENFESFREACLNVVWGLPRSEVHNRKRWLRKYLRMAGTASMPVASVQGFQSIPDGDKATIISDYADPVRQVTFDFGSGLFGDLCTADGVDLDGGSGVRDFYITRQISKS